jgi:hypothetical protein
VPRKGRGGSRNGTPGVAYPNRSDLNAPKVAQPRFTGQEYGQATQQAQATQAVPVGQAPTDVEALRAAAAGHDFPQLPPMGAETAHPREPITAGMAMGAGPGPESLMPLQNNRTPSQADLMRMARVLPSLEALADLPDTSDTFRTYVRTLRGQARNV